MEKSPPPDPLLFRQLPRSAEIGRDTLFLIWLRLPQPRPPFLEWAHRRQQIGGHPTPA